MPSHTLVPSNMQIAKKFAQIIGMILKYVVPGKSCSRFSKKKREKRELISLPEHQGSLCAKEER